MINVTIKKPLFGSKVYIRDKYLNQAHRQKTQVCVSCKGEKYIVDPKEWIHTGDKMEKVFLIPEKPMVLWGNFLEKFKKEV